MDIVDDEGLIAARKLFEAAFSEREDDPAFAVTALGMALGMGHAKQAHAKGADFGDPRIETAIQLSAQLMRDTVRIILSRDT